ncbi:IPT/TIG domain-containing protein [Micromonospora viridifaciens]|uniref:IPT/TIG domain-containing protein n=1 Tax=Micromonospora viridifaciens TaxID=1881 RepID=UPI0012FE2388|nr:IPT/TIG domain-containing protein [Micromonospora viridifaciens]
MVVDLSADVDGVAVVNADAVIGSATAPPGGGTDTFTLLAISLPGAVGVSASGTVEEVTATRAPGESSALSRVNDLNLRVLGVDVVNAAEATASVTCPLTGPQAADTALVGLELFGSAVTLAANGPSVDASTAVTVPGLTGAALNASLTRIEDTTATGATAVAVRAFLTLTGTALGAPVSIPVGTVIIAEASCERPATPVPPTAASITPNAGPQSGGQTVTITGSGFVPGTTKVTFDGTPATDVVVAAGGTSLTAVTPPGAVGPASVVVSTPGGSAVPLGYTYLADGSGATITGLTPSSGPTAGGTTVTITGTGLGGATGVTFDGVPGTGFTVNPAGTAVTVVTPPNAAGPAAVRLVFPAGEVTAPTFTYVAPTITSVVPNEGPSSGGTTVTITGTGLGGATGVNFGNTPGKNLVVDPSGTSLTVVTPPGTPGTVDVTVLIPGANATAPDAFTYRAAPPVIDTLTPGRGPTAGGTTVTIHGAGFIPGQTTVTICGRTIPADEVTVAADGRSLSFRTPACQAGDTTVTVTTPSGSSNPLTFRYVGQTLPVTGNSIGTPLTFGVILVIVGAFLLLLSRRARNKSSM